MTALLLDSHWLRTGDAVLGRVSRIGYRGDIKQRRYDTDHCSNECRL